MSYLLRQTPFIDDFNLIERKEREENDRLLRSIISEEKGSYSGQFEKAERIAKELLKNGYKDSEYEEDGYSYVLKLDNNAIAPSRGSTVGNVVNIVINPSVVRLSNITSTIAHELMHVFQQGLKKVDGISENSMFLYSYLISFANQAYSRFSYLFFYGIYFCFSIERKANVSSVANYLKSCIGDKNKCSEDIENALLDCDKYEPYVRFYEFFSHAKPTQQDIAYIRDCMTRELKNPFNGKVESIYDGLTFNTEKFVNQNVQQIMKYSNDTIKKMHKNAMIFVERND